MFKMTITYLAGRRMRGTNAERLALSTAGSITATGGKV